MDNHCPSSKLKQPWRERSKGLSLLKTTNRVVDRRYQAKDYKRMEIGRIMMDAQYVAGELMRPFSDRDMRSGLAVKSTEGRDYQERFYPTLSG